MHQSIHFGLSVIVQCVQTAFCIERFKYNVAKYNQWIGITILMIKIRKYIKKQSFFNLF